MKDPSMGCCPISGDSTAWATCADARVPWPRSFGPAPRQSCASWGPLYPGNGFGFLPKATRQRRSAIGALLPPPYTEKRIGRFPRLIAALDRIERRVETWWPLPMLADHYLLEF